MLQTRPVLNRAQRLNIVEFNRDSGPLIVPSYVVEQRPLVSGTFLGVVAFLALVGVAVAANLGALDRHEDADHRNHSVSRLSGRR